MRRPFERQPSAWRTRGLRTLCAALAVATVVVLAGPAHAGSVWDPDDVAGPLDIRWLGVTFQTDDTTRLTISLYDGFRTAALPTVVRTGSYPGYRGRGSLWVDLTAYFSGYFVHRLDGRLIFRYADFGSSCCNVARVPIPSGNVLRVTLATLHDPADPTYEV